MVEPESQADYRLKNTFAYTRITAKAVRQKLIESVYTKGVKPSKEKLAEIQAFIVRHADLGKWDVTIRPEKVYS